MAVIKCPTVVNLFYGDVIFFCFDIELRSYTDTVLSVLNLQLFLCDPDRYKI